MKIPEIRVEMLALAERLDDAGLVAYATKLRALEQELYRRPPIRRASRNKTTPPAFLIRAYAEANPDMDFADMATEIGVATGRISEALNGRRV